MDPIHLPIYRQSYQLHLYVDKKIMSLSKKYYYTIGMEVRKRNIKFLLKVFRFVSEKDWKKRETIQMKLERIIEEIKLLLNILQSYSQIDLKSLSYILHQFQTIEHQFYLMNIKNKE